MSLKAISFLQAVGMVVLAVAAIIGLFALSAGHSGGGAVVALAVASLVVLYRVHVVHDRRVKAEKAAYDERRLAELLALTSQSDEVVHFTGSSNWGFTLYAALVGIAMLAFAWAERLPLWVALLIGATAVLLLVTGSLSLIEVLPLVGKPVLSISRSGFGTPVVPHVPWEAVDRMEFKLVVPGKGSPYHELKIRIPDLAARVAGFHWSARFLYRRRSPENKAWLPIRLYATPDAPEVIFQVARKCWVERSGHKDA